MRDQYIKMVLALPPEFFTVWKWQKGDQFILREDRRHKIHCIGDSVLYNEKPYDLRVTTDDIADNLFDAVPLPSQKQLQSMLNLNQIEFIEDFYAYSQEPLLPNMDNEQFKTDLDCFTLAYVVDRKFKKYWDGEKWISMNPVQSA